MHPLVALLLFCGMALIIHSVYEERYNQLRQERKIEYRFIPRTLYDEQLVQPDLLVHFKGMFESGTPWYGEAVTAAQSQLPPRRPLAKQQPASKPAPAQ